MTKSVTHIVLGGIDGEPPEELLAEEFSHDLAKLNPVKLRRTSDIGEGASWPVDIFVIDWEAGLIGGSIALFLAGEKIEANLDAWRRLLKRFSSGFGELKRKYNRVFLADDSAFLIGAAAVLEKAGNSNSLRLISTLHFDYKAGKFVEAKDLSGFKTDDPIGKSVAASSAYLAVFAADNCKIYVACIGRDGGIKFVAEM